MRHQRGFTLVEIMVAVGMMGGLALAGMQLFKGQTSAQRNVEANYEVTTIVQQMRTLLTIPANCTLSLGGINPDGSGPASKLPIAMLKKEDLAIVPLGYSPVFQVGVTQPGNIKVVKYTLSRKATDPSDETLLTIEFSKGEGAIRSQAIKMMKIIFQKDASGNILSCYAYNTAQDSYWQQASNNTDFIYYPSSIGVGTAEPQANVDIQSPDANGNVPTILQLGTAGGSAAQQSLIQMETLGGNVSPASRMNDASHKGWQIYARGNAYSAAGEQNDFGIKYWSGAGWSNNFTIDSLTGNVGIGTTTPAYALDVVGAAQVSSASGSEMLNISSGAGYTHVNIENTNSAISMIRFLRGGSARWSAGINGTTDDFVISGASDFLSNNYLTIEKSDGTIQFGQTGMGTPASGPYFYFGESTNNSDPIAFRRVNNSNNRSDLRIIIGDENGASRPSDEDRLLIGSTGMSTAVNISSYGYVGVNTGNNSPYSRLTVNGSGTSKTDGLAVTTGSSWLNIYNPAGTSAAIDVTTGGSATAPGSTGANLILNPSGGNVGVGIATPDRDLTVLGTGKFYTSALSSMPGTWGGGIWTRDFYGEGSLWLGTNGNASVTFTSAGNGTITGSMRAASFLYGSDERLKEDVQTLQNPKSTVRALRGVSFTWKEVQTEDIGFIAQEVEKVEPRLVVTQENGLKAVKYGNIVAIVVEAIKELISDSEDMKEQIQLLKKQNEYLQTQVHFQGQKISDLEKNAHDRQVKK